MKLAEKEFQAYGNNITVRIDKEAQKKKVFLNKFIQIAPAFEYMLYNLQFAEIVSVGNTITRPEIKAGRQAIFHHKVESDANHLLKVFDNGDELRWVTTSTNHNSHQYYGVIDEAGNIIPAEEFIFCDAKNIKDADEEAVLEELTTDYIPGTAMKINVKKSKDSLLYTAEFANKKDETEDIYQNLTVKFTPPAETWIKPEDIITVEAWAMYPLTLLGNNFQIILREFILMKRK